MDRDGKTRMPVLFVGHGNPMNAIETNAFSTAWEEMGRVLERPRAILCVSAHWETSGSSVTAQERPPTIHDFYGFPEELFAVEYPAPGAPWLAARVREVCRTHPVTLDQGWGLDHGAWSVLCRMFPGADVPVVQLSLDRGKSPADHYAMGRELLPLRDEGVLVLGSGNIVHNLGRINWAGGAYAWAKAFDGRVAAMIRSGKHEEILALLDGGPDVEAAAPTTEHFLPLLYCLALQQRGEQVKFFTEEVVLGSLSMRSLIIHDVQS